MSSTKEVNKTDIVKTFPSIVLPPPKSKNGVSSSNSKLMKEIERDMNKNEILPGVLKTAKPYFRDKKVESSELPLFVGFSAANLMLDGNAYANNPPTFGHNRTDFAHQQQVSVVDINENVAPYEYAASPPHSPPADQRTYNALMDQFSLHNLMIYDGTVLKSTPEFQSFRRTFAPDWVPIKSILSKLEVLMAECKVKLAIINGQNLHSLAILNNPLLSREDMLTCVDNIDDVLPVIQAVDKRSGNLIFAIIKLQYMCRRWLSRKAMQRARRRVACAQKIQTIVLGFLARLKIGSKLRRRHHKMNEYFAQNIENLNNVLARLGEGSQTVMLEGEEGTKLKKLLIFIPSLSSLEHFRVEYSQFHSMENSNLGCLYQLRDPDVEILYVCPCQSTESQLDFHQNMISMLKIEAKSFAKRVHFVVPDLISKLPQHTTLAQALWYSNESLQKIKKIIQANHFNAMIIPSSVTWVEKRLSFHLNVPIVAPDPVVAETITSRSFVKSIFMEAQLNTPVGAHDIHSQDDFLVATARLISCNIDINRWIVRLNNDFNGESTVVLDIHRWPLIYSLRSEYSTQQKVNEHNPNFWFSRSNQISVRKRTLKALQHDAFSSCHICRSDIYSSWSMYLVHLGLYGGTIEAEPANGIIGYVRGLCFIDPCTTMPVVTMNEANDEVSLDNKKYSVRLFNGMDLYADPNYSTFGSFYPQCKVPKDSLEAASESVANVLYNKYKVIGYLAVNYLVFWDPIEKLPKMWALNIELGKSQSFDCIGIIGHLNAISSPKAYLNASKPNISQRNPSIVDVSDIAGIASDLVLQGDRYCIHIPFASHEALCGSRDDTFFRLCKMEGIAFDAKTYTGVLFFLIESIIGGGISFMCIAKSKKKVVIMAIQLLTFVSLRFGKEMKEEARQWHQVPSMLSTMRRVLKKLEDASAALLTKAGKR